MGHKPIRTPRNIKNELRDAQALELRKAGASFDQIAKQLGYAHKSGAHHSVMRALKASLSLRNDSAAELRELMLARLDAYRLGIYRAATSGSPRAVEVALKIEERTAMLLGLDAPKRAELSGPEGGPIEIEQRIVDEDDDARRIIDIVERARARISETAQQSQPALDAPTGSAGASLA